MNPTQLGLIAIGGALGALSRYYVGYWVQSHMPKSQFPWGTFVINASGSFLLGLIMTLLTARILVSPNWRPLISIGFIGAYTTFSTFEYETAQITSSWLALCNLVGSVVIGYGCVIFGIRLADVIASAMTRLGR